MKKFIILNLITVVLIIPALSVAGDHNAITDANERGMIQTPNGVLYRDSREGQAYLNRYGVRSNTTAGAQAIAEKQALEAQVLAKAQREQGSVKGTQWWNDFARHYSPERMRAYLKGAKAVAIVGMGLAAYSKPETGIAATAEGLEAPGDFEAGVSKLALERNPGSLLTIRPLVETPKSFKAPRKIETRSTATSK